jgi:predicted ATP-grasp superfamily ATP-dependent carboligase
VEKHKNKVYILKPDTGCQGDGISIINKIDDLRNLNWSKEYVA